MPKCPYCKEELELNLTLAPTPITDDFKGDILEAYESFVDIQAEVVPFGGKMVKRMAKFTLKFVQRYFDRIGAIPIIIHACKNCDSTITTESLIDLMSTNRSGS